MGALLLHSSRHKQMRITTLLLLFALAIFPGAAAAAQSDGLIPESSETTGAPAKKQSGVSEAEASATAEPPREEGQTKAGKATLIIRVRVPLMKKRTDVFMLNPFSTAPPKVAIPVAPLPEKGDDLKQKILNSGYNQRLSMTRPYPDGGWRWYYCYDRARKKSGIGEPHLFFQMYNFANDLMPWVVPETKRSNKMEENRIKNYFALKQSYTDNHKDEEMEALRLGLEPIRLNFVPVRRGDVLETSLFVSPGDWWITGSHKVPGLVYFWQEPIKLHDGETLTKDLTEENAILVQGGW